MSELYDKPFKLGFVATIAFFAVLNVVAYMFAANQYQQLLSRPIRLAPVPRFPEWGVPFSWEGSLDLFGAAQGLVLNFIAIVAIAFLVGSIVRFFALRIK